MSVSDIMSVEKPPIVRGALVSAWLLDVLRNEVARGRDGNNEAAVFAAAVALVNDLEARLVSRT